MLNLNTVEDCSYDVRWAYVVEKDNNNTFIRFVLNYMHT